MNRQQLKEILETFFMSGDVVEIRTFFTKKRIGKKEIKVRNYIEHFKYPKELDKLIDTIEKLDNEIRTGNRPTSGLYFGVHPRWEKKEKWKASSDNDIKHMHVLYIDIDLFKDETKKDREEQKIAKTEVEFNGIKVQLSKQWAIKNKETAKKFTKELAESVKTELIDIGYEPFLIVDSGFGIHMYFKFNKIITDSIRYKQYFDYMLDRIAEILAELLNIDIGLARLLLDDSIHNKSRVSRIPGSANTKLAYYVNKDTAKIEFNPDAIMETKVLHFDPDVDYLNIEELDNVINSIKTVRNAQARKEKAKITATGERAQIWEKYIKKYNLEEITAKAREAGLKFIETDSEEVIDTIARHLTLLAPLEGFRHNFYLYMPGFFLLRGLGPQTVMKIFDRLLDYTITLGIDEEDEVEDRIKPAVESIANYFKWKLGEKVYRPPVGWKNVFFKTSSETIGKNWRELEINDRAIHDITWKLKNLKKEDWNLIKIKTIKENLNDPEKARGIAEKIIRREIFFIEQLVKNLQQKKQKLEKGKGRPSKAEEVTKEITEKDKEKIEEATTKAKNVHEYVIAKILELINTEYRSNDEIKEIWKDIEKKLIEHYMQLFAKYVVEAVKVRSDKISDSTNISLLIRFNNEMKEKLTITESAEKYSPVANETGLIALMTLGGRKADPARIVNNFAGINTKFALLGEKLYLGDGEILTILARMLEIDEYDIILEKANVYALVRENYYYWIAKTLERFIRTVWAKAPTELESEEKELTNEFITMIAIAEKVKANSAKAVAPDALNIAEKEDIMILPVRLIKIWTEKKASRQKKLIKLLKKLGMLKEDTPRAVETTEDRRIAAFILKYSTVREFVKKATGIDIADEIKDITKEKVESLAERIADKLLQKLIHNPDETIEEEYLLARHTPQAVEEIIKCMQKLAKERYNVELAVEGKSGERRIYIPEDDLQGGDEQ